MSLRRLILPDADQEQKRPFPHVPLDGVEVAVLGPVTIRGAAAPFQRSAAFDLVVYLAFHRFGVRHAEWALAIWPDRPVALPTVHSTASDARRALGSTPDGVAHLPRGVELRLRDSVTTDVERFAALSVSDQPHRLHEAMQLIRGPLFSGLRRADWAVFDGTQSWIESLVVRYLIAWCRGILCELVAAATPHGWSVRRSG